MKRKHWQSTFSCSSQPSPHTRHIDEETILSIQPIQAFRWLQSQLPSDYNWKGSAQWELRKAKPNPHVELWQIIIHFLFKPLGVGVVCHVAEDTWKTHCLFSGPLSFSATLAHVPHVDHCQTSGLTFMAELSLPTHLDMLGPTLL